MRRIDRLLLFLVELFLYLFNLVLIMIELNIFINFANSEIILQHNIIPYNN